MCIRDSVSNALATAVGNRGIFNISAGSEVPVSQIFELLREASGKDSEPELAPLREGELERSRMDPSRAAEVLGWKAEIPLEQGVPDTYNALVEEFEGT